MKRLKRTCALLIATVMIFAVLLTGCNPEQVLKDIATDFISIYIESPSGNLLAESNDNQQVYTYSIAAEIRNNYMLPLVKAEIKLNVPDNVEITDLGDDGEISVALIQQDEVKNYEWIVKIPMTDADQNIEYNVSLESEVSSVVEEFGLLFVEGKKPGDKRLDFSSDTWKFRNYSEVPIPLTQEDYNALMHRFSNADRERLKEIIRTSANGYCYGMAITTILAKVGRLDVANIDAGASNLHEVNKNANAKSLIGYYWIMQFLEIIQDDMTQCIAMDTADKLTLMENKAKAVENGSNPFVLSFYTNAEGSVGHAVVGYSHENGVFNWDNKTYDSRILVYDNNFPKWTAKSCLYYNKGTDEWYIPNYPNSSEIVSALSDITIMDVNNIEMNRKSVNSYITARENLGLSIYKEGVLMGTVDGSKVTSGGNVVAFFNSGSDALTIVVPPSSATESEKKPLTIKPTTSGEVLNLDIKYDDYYLTATAQGADGVTFAPEGSVEISGNATDFEIEVTANDDVAPMEWYKLSVAGNSCDSPKVEIEGNGYILSGENMNGIKVRAENESEAKELKVKTKENYVLITEKEDGICAMVDTDDDGIYETVLSESKNVDVNEPMSANGTNWGLILTIIGAVLGVVIIAAAIVMFVRSKNKKKKNSGFDNGNGSSGNDLFL